MLFEETWKEIRNAVSRSTIRATSAKNVMCSRNIEMLLTPANEMRYQKYFRTTRLRRRTFHRRSISQTLSNIAELEVGLLVSQQPPRRFRMDVCGIQSCLAIRLPENHNRRTDDQRLGMKIHILDALKEVEGVIR